MFPFESEWLRGGWRRYRPLSVTRWSALAPPPEARVCICKQPSKLHGPGEELLAFRRRPGRRTHSLARSDRMLKAISRTQWCLSLGGLLLTHCSDGGNATSTEGSAGSATTAGTTSTAGT